MTKLQSLYQELEAERQRLAKIITMTGLTSEETLRQSKFVDDLLNKINKLEKDKNVY
ncbi:MAG: Spo0E family sporulation regulatory protein-aspartic acid phosphatase [Firmicutes bacterium]|nr:Spo0E family sporulation regulatory protein-aspartic acid phosphatase [Bacillota bacterium]